VTARLRLEPLGPEHAALDHAAVMGSRDHLRATTPWGDWPRDDLTLAEDTRDLERHRGEFDRREAFAYTVLAPDRSRCLGCVYLAPLPRAGAPAEPRHASLIYWVTDDALADDLDHHLVEALLEWLGAAWPVDAVGLLPVSDDRRAVDRLLAAGLAEQPAPLAGCRLFLRPLG